jgi:hypothetical protein
MKNIVIICLVFCVGLAWGGDASTAVQPGTVTLKGEVLETKDVGTYTYMRLKTKDGETWAAVGKAAVKKGDAVTIENAMVISNFESKTLKQTFAKIVFGNLAGADANMAAAHAGTSAATDVGDVKVPKATGADAKTVAEITTRAASMKDKTVTLRGKVVKFNAGIMGRNWVHLRDGSGTAADGTDDILATTKDDAKVGDVVLVKGTVRIDKDFGAGYSYKVLIEEASLQK